MATTTKAVCHTYTTIKHVVTCIIIYMYNMYLCSVSSHSSTALPSINHISFLKARHNYCRNGEKKAKKENHYPHLSFGVVNVIVPILIK